MKYDLFIDDIRNPEWVYGKRDFTWIIARSYDQAIQVISEINIPTFISFDHDLGDDKSGFDIAKWIIEYDLDQNVIDPKIFKFQVHSSNPVGTQNIISLMNNYITYKKCRVGL